MPTQRDPAELSLTPTGAVPYTSVKCEAGVGDTDVRVPIVGAGAAGQTSGEMGATLAFARQMAASDDRASSPDRGG
jgi:hypothetical protein